MHALHRQWDVWFKGPHKAGRPVGGAWFTDIQKIASVDTVEHFWGIVDSLLVPSKLRMNSDYYIFDSTVQPLWEDPSNSRGGKWVAKWAAAEASCLNNAWEEACMAAVGEQLSTTHVCGILASMRKREARLAVWVRDADVEVGQKAANAIGAPMNYYTHASCIDSSEPPALHTVNAVNAPLDPTSQTTEAC